MAEPKTPSASLSSIEHQQDPTATIHHVHLGYATALPRNRSLLSILGMTLAIAAIPFGMGGPLISAIYGGGQLSLFVGLLVVLILDGCVAVSLAELASRYPTSSGVYYWSYRLCEGHRYGKAVSFITGWFWLVGNWCITLSVNFGFALLIAATVAIYRPEWTASSWVLLLIFYAVCIMTFVICSVGDRLLPYVDKVAAIWNFVTIIVILIALTSTAMAGRRSAKDGLGAYDASFSGWGQGWTFFIGLLPPAYSFSAIGMITSMAEECKEPELEVPRAISLSVPVGGLAALLFVLPINFTLPPLEDVILAPYGQALPYILITVMGSRPGAVIVMLTVLLVTFFCSISITTTASRCTWALSRDKALPSSWIWARTDYGRPLFALALVTIIQMLLGLISLGSSSAFTAFVSVGVLALAMGYLIPIAISLLTGRQEVSRAGWTAGKVVGRVTNIVAICWILLELVLFSMPTALPVTRITMNYASVVLVGFFYFSVAYYIFVGRIYFQGPPDEVFT